MDEIWWNVGGRRTGCAGLDGATTMRVRYGGTWVEQELIVQEWMEQQPHG